MKISKILFLLLLFINSIFGQEKARIMTYNTLNYPDYYSIRNPYFKKIFDYVKPDILVCQEMTSLYAVNLFLSKNLSNKYNAATFIDGFDTDNALFYKDSLFEFISNVQIKTALRDFNQFTLVHKITGDTLLIYSAHLKANTGEEAKRLAEVQVLRGVTDKLPVGKNFIVLGDFNIYTSTEPAYQKLIDNTTSGYFIDPIIATGNWNNNSAFKSIHTQSTRVEALLDGGSTGGLDDRFDMILISQAIKDPGGVRYIPGTYTIVGNDGNHFNKAINAQPNAAVPVDIADALYYSSDHLPVYAEFEFNGPVSVKKTELQPDGFMLYQNFPNPFGSAINSNITTIKFSIPNLITSSAKENEDKVTFQKDYQSVLVSLKVYDILGQEVSTILNEYKSAGNYEVKFDGSNLPSGVYLYKLQSGDFVQTKKIILLK